MAINALEFINKWKDVKLSERSACHQHFLDLCELMGHPKPVEVDKTGKSFTFEKGAEKVGGGTGWADVWKRSYFGWEYKKKRADLGKAYDQLLLYREALENPPLLVVCDMNIIEVHTNFTNTRTDVHKINLTELANPRSLEVLRAVFFAPNKLKPGQTSEAITSEAAKRIGTIAQRLRERGENPALSARLLDRIVFCMFAEDIGLLENDSFSEILEHAGNDPARFQKLLKQLFEAMAHGGDFGVVKIRHFNGSLFTDEPVLLLDSQDLSELSLVARLDWSAIDPSIFGTLFERGLDPEKRKQIGAHYTSREDIETLIEPVVMWPLRLEWDEIRRQADSLFRRGGKKKGQGATRQSLRAKRKKARELVHGFLLRLSLIKILDPACGSGNFLYVALQKLKGLEKDIIVWAANRKLDTFLPLVQPNQLYGIEINPYAYELAQMTVWIGYIQWIHSNGYGTPSDPILEPLQDNFLNMDAILDQSEQANPKEPNWPEADFIVGNPPFLGDKRMRRALGDDYVDQLRRLYKGRLPGQSDLCCYWFEKARCQIEQGSCQRAGLLGTQGIRGGKNRFVLERIKATGNIFFAVSDRGWVLDGANVHVSLVGFDSGKESRGELNGRAVTTINSNLTGGTSKNIDITKAKRLNCNAGLCHLGVMKAGKFDISEAVALEMLASPNPHSLPNSDVLRPRLTARDILHKGGKGWIIDFGCETKEDEGSLYEKPWEYIMEHVKPKRMGNRRERLAEKWWIHGECRPGLRNALNGIDRFIITPEVSKHRVFAWLDVVFLADHQTRAIALSDDYSFGVLHSWIHEVWARAQGTQLRERKSGFRYTPTTCFETFPFPKPPKGQEQHIATIADELNEKRSSWLYPDDWVCEEILEFLGGLNGPWSKYVRNPNKKGIGTVRYPRLMAKNEECAGKLKSRTLTNLYNQNPTWLKQLHQKLDEAVFAAYGWSSDISNESLLSKLLELNLEQSQSSAVVTP